MKSSKLVLCIFLATAIFLVFLSGCFTKMQGGNATDTGADTAPCSPGYSRYPTSEGHCCPAGSMYYREGNCWQCQEGFVYDRDSGKCCPFDFPYYYNRECNRCQREHFIYNTSAGHCCPKGYPYYYSDRCWDNAEGSGASQSSYYLSCCRCKGAAGTYSYTGDSFEICNAYYQACVISECDMVTSNCR